MNDLFAAQLGPWLSSAGATFLLIALAEIGDKSQLVCMTLAARHRPAPVIIGAISAFAILNMLAVLFGRLPGIFISSLIGSRGLGGWVRRGHTARSRGAHVHRRTWRGAGHGGRPGGRRGQGERQAVPARQAHSHWASVGSESPKCLQ